MIFKTSIATILTVIFAISPTSPLECHSCEPCNDIGQKVTCSAGQSNCMVAFGYLENFVGITKGCSSKSLDRLGSTFCEGFAKQKMLGFEFKNSTGCLCGLDDCNSKVIPTDFQYRNLLKYVEEMSTNLRCLQCNPCTDEGVEVLCPNGVQNCFQTTGLLDGTKTLIKGCEDARKTKGKITGLVCQRKASVRVFNHTITQATNCLCDKQNCNVKKPTDPDDVIPKLECYTCNGDCNNSEVLTVCSNHTNNCYVGHGIEADTKKNVTIKGCGDANIFPTLLADKECKLHQEYTLSSKIYNNFSLCGCPRKGCNSKDKIPGGLNNTKELMCYECNPCMNDGVLVKCPKEKFNCLIVNGLKNKINVTMKGCTGNDTVLLKQDNKICQPFTNYKFKSGTYTNATVCVCSKDGCNKGLEVKSVPPLSKALKCYECYNCTDVGTLVTCPESTVNCHYFEGDTQTSSTTKKKIIGKGCAPIDLIPSRLKSKQCFSLPTYTLNGTTLTNIKACGCSTDLCNDELKKKLECYQCERCRGDEKLVTCAKDSLNCYVLSGKIGLFEVSSRGCSSHLTTALSQPVCTKYSRYQLAGITFKRVIVCACSGSKCNQPKIPAQALFNQSSKANVCVWSLGIVFGAFFFSIFFAS